jgi:hypothetical protein
MRLYRHKPIINWRSLALLLDAPDLKKVGV